MKASQKLLIVSHLSEFFDVLARCAAAWDETH